MTFKELREASGMTRKQFVEYFGIPYRTVQDWELGNRECNDYLLDLMEYKLNASALINAIKEECRIAQEHNIRIHTDAIVELLEKFNGKY